MKKIILSLLICIFSLAGCRKAADEIAGVFNRNDRNNTSDSREDDSPVRLGNEKTYFNDYLGLSYTVPRGWWLYELNEENFNETKGEILSHISMDIDYYDDYSRIWMINFGNLEYSTSVNHIGITFDARSSEGISGMAAYMRYFEDYMLEPTDTEDYSLREGGRRTIGGKVFEMRDYLVSREEDDYYIMTLSCEVGNGYYLNIFVDYWPENNRAKEDVIESISESIDFF